MKGAREEQSGPGVGWGSIFVLEMKLGTSHSQIGCSLQFLNDNVHLLWNWASSVSDINILEHFVKFSQLCTV